MTYTNRLKSLNLPFFSTIEVWGWIWLWHIRFCTALSMYQWKKFFSTTTPVQDLMDWSYTNTIQEQKHSFAARVIYDWNFPSDIVMATNINSFKTMLDAYLSALDILHTVKYQNSYMSMKTLWIGTADYSVCYMLCCTAQNFALIYAQYCVPQFPCFAIKFAIHE